MWWVLLIFLLLGKRSGGVSASVKVGSPAGAPLQVLTLNPPITENNLTTSGPFLPNPDIGTFHRPLPPTQINNIRPIVENNMYTLGTDDPAINTVVGPPPPDVGAPLPPSNTIANLIVMAPPPPEPLPQLAPAGFTQIATGISIPTGSNDGIIMTPRISQL